MPKITIEEVNRKIEELTPTVKKMYEMLVVTNGDLSIMERLRNIETYMKDEKKAKEEETEARENRQEDARKERAAYVRLIFGIVFTQIITWLGTFLYWVFYIVPSISK